MLVVDYPVERYNISWMRVSLNPGEEFMNMVNPRYDVASVFLTHGWYSNHDVPGYPLNGSYGHGPVNWFMI